MEFRARIECAMTERGEERAPTNADELPPAMAALAAGGEAAQRALPQLYEELRAVAEQCMRRERADHTLQATALVHEAYLRMLGAKNLAEANRLQFLEAAAVTMRRVLVDHARKDGASKRGANWERVTLQGLLEGGGEEELDVLALHDALEELARLDARQARIVELRFFAGMTGQEIADHLRISRNTVVRELTMARAWLHRSLAGEAGAQ